MSAAVLYFLFAMVAGSGDTASLTTLGKFPDLKACTAAQSKVLAAVKEVEQPAHIFCLSGDALAPIAKAAKQGD